MRITDLSADAFCESIELALVNPPNVDGSIARIKKMLNRLPDEKFHVSDQGYRATFYTVTNGKQIYLSKKDSKIHSMARMRYLTMLLKILELSGSNRKCDIERRRNLIIRLQKFILSCAKGGLDISKIVLTSNQHEWFTGQFKQKPIDLDSALLTAHNLPVRSKSERDIIDSYDALAVPLHYEEQMTIRVQRLIDELEADLIDRGLLNGELWYWDRNGKIRWNVPGELQIMNSPGSIWKTYYPPSGTIKMHNDIKGMFSDGSFFIHEHEGVMDSFIYRYNSSERIAVMKYTGSVNRKNLVETFEYDVNTLEKRRALIERHILPRLWF